MNSEKIALKVESLSNSKAEAGAYALLLQEIGIKRRQLPIIIGAGEAMAINVEMQGIVTPRPLTYDLFATTLEVMRIDLTEVYIYKVNKGVFFSYLLLKSDDETVRIDARTSDAISLALRLSAPIYIDERILESEQILPSDFNAADTPRHTSRPFDIEQLRARLQEAVEAENFEEAVRLRDEINRMK